MCGNFNPFSILNNFLLAILLSDKTNIKKKILNSHQVYNSATLQLFVCYLMAE